MSHFCFLKLLYVARLWRQPVYLGYITPRVNWCLCVRITQHLYTQRINWRTMKYIFLFERYPSWIAIGCCCKEWLPASLLAFCAEDFRGLPPPPRAFGSDALKKLQKLAAKGVKPSEAGLVVTRDDFRRGLMLWNERRGRRGKLQVDGCWKAPFWKSKMDCWGRPYAWAGVLQKSAWEILA